jgi:hypothetical protein
VKLFGAALKKAAKKESKEGLFYLFIYFMFGECCAPSGEGIGRGGGCFGDAVDVGSDFGGKDVWKSDVNRP